MNKAEILALVDKGRIMIPQALDMMYQQGRKKAIEDLLMAIEDCDYISIDHLVELADQIKEKKNERRVRKL